MSLLNSTVKRLQKVVDSTLTQAYLDIYGNDDAGSRVELHTVVSPLAACEEVLALYQGGLADFEVAAPLALNAIGADNTEITQALKRHEALASKGTVIDPMVINSMAAVAGSQMDSSGSSGRSGSSSKERHPNE